MQVILITLLIFILSPLACMSFADEGCMNTCADDKRMNDMYCPPAGGFTDEDHKQCVDKGNAHYNECIKSCSPPPPSPVTPPADQPTTMTPPPSDEPATTDKQ